MFRSILHSLKTQALRQYAGLYIRYRNHPPGNAGVIFSVVIPIYDRTRVVKEAIESILNQSFKNFELLLVMDGSPRETKDVVMTYKDHPQVRVFHFDRSSGNACRGRNYGIKKARGNYIAFLDSDDLADPARLERTLYHFLVKKVDIVGGAYECLVEHGSERGITDGQIGYRRGECSYRNLLKQNMLGICTVSVKRECLLTFGGFRQEMRYREDHELWLRLVRNGCAVFNSPEIFSTYRVHQGNAETQYLKDDDHWFSQAIKLHKCDYSWE